MSGHAKSIGVDNIVTLTKLTASLPLAFTGASTKFTPELTPMMTSSSTATETIGAHVAHPQKSWQTRNGVIVSVHQIQGHLLYSFTLNDMAGLRLVAFQPVDSFLFFFCYHPKMVDFLSSNFGVLN